MRDLDTILEPLVSRPADAPLPLAELQRRVRSRTHRRRAVLAVTAVLAVGAPVLAASRGADHPLEVRNPTAAEPGDQLTSTASTTASTNESTTSVSTTTSLPTSTLGPGAPAPWAGPPLPEASAAATMKSWSSPGSPGAECPAVAPADLGEGAGAKARASTRGQPGAWWVAYDLPGAPGEADIQTPAAGVGKETFSVSAIVSGGSVDGLPNKVTFSDGSHGSYGPEGNGTLPMPDGVSYPWLAYLRIGNAPCVYQVHTYLGRNHLEQLLASLRFVEGAP